MHMELGNLAGSLRSRRGPNRSQPRIQRRLRGMSNRSRYVGVSLLGSLLVLGNLTAGCSGDSGSASGKPDKLVVASWGGSWTQKAKKYMYEPFSKDTGIEVVVDTVPSGFDASVAQQQQSSNVTWDLLDAPGTLPEYVIIKHGWAAPFPKRVIDEISPKVRSGTLRPSKKKPYFLEYGASSRTIACNPNLVKRCPTSAKQFFDVKSYPGTRALPSYSPYDTMMFALLADGVPKDNIFPMDIPRAISKLKEIKPHVTVWADSSTCEQALAGKQVAIAFCPSDREYTVKDESIPNIRITWQDCITSDDGWTVVKNAPHADAAWTFIKWAVRHPKAQANLSKALSVTVPTTQLDSLLSKKEFQRQSAAHEDQATYEDGPSLANSNEEIQKAWQNFIPNE